MKTQEMRTLRLTNNEIATIKTAITMQIQSLNREIRMYEEKGGHVSDGLLEMKQQYETVFEALAF